MFVIRAIVAECPEIDILAHIAEAHDIDGLTVFRDGYGWTLEWGSESVALIEVVSEYPLAKGHINPVRGFLIHLLAFADQECAYVTEDGTSPALFYVDGRLERF